MEKFGRVRASETQKQPFGKLGDQVQEKPVSLCVKPSFIMIVMIIILLLSGIGAGSNTVPVLFRSTIIGKPLQVQSRLLTTVKKSKDAKIETPSLFVLLYLAKAQEYNNIIGDNQANNVWIHIFGVKLNPEPNFSPEMQHDHKQWFTNHSNQKYAFTCTYEEDLLK